MSIVQITKNALYNIGDSMLTAHRKRNEINKFRHPSRKAIYESVTLTNEQKKAIDTLYQNNLGRKIPYTWHRHFTAFTGNFDPSYFPEHLYIPEFEHYMNLNNEVGSAITDKNLLPLIASSVGIKMPKTILSSCAGLLRDETLHPISIDEAQEILNKCGVVFAKPAVDSSSGEGCRLLNFANGMDQYSGMNLQEAFSDLGQDFVIQERITCSSSIRRLYDGSVNTFRVITYRWKDEICTMPVIMRIGQGGRAVDNAHAGGMFIAVNNDGVLGKTAFTEFKQEYTKHPNSNIIFDDYRIENFEKVMQSAVKMHCALPQVGVVNWDFTLNADEVPILIEANVNWGSVWLIEMAHGKGAFGERTPEVLRWIGFMEKTAPSNRKQFAFGKTE